MSSSKEIQANLSRAEMSLGAAQLLLETKFYNDAASRAYYSAFHGATALLLSKGLSFNSHSGLLRAVSLNFVKPGILDKHFGRELSTLYELRSVGDYGELRQITESEAEQAIKTAAAFFEKVCSILSE